MSSPARPSEPIASTVERIAAAYLEAAGHDARAAIRNVIADALVDLCEAERRTLRRDRLISRGYVRGRIEAEDRPCATDGAKNG